MADRGIPCWSGMWFEIEGLGYMEVSDHDERTHRPPAGWTLAEVSINVRNSSQIFRYLPVDEMAVVVSLSELEAQQ